MTENPQNIETAVDPDMPVGGEDAVVDRTGLAMTRGPGRHASRLLEAALARFRAEGIDVLALSSWWRSAAWPDPSDPPFVNGVAVIVAPPMTPTP